MIELKDLQKLGLSKESTLFEVNVKLVELINCEPDLEKRKIIVENFLMKVKLQFINKEI